VARSFPHGRIRRSQCQLWPLSLQHPFSHHWRVLVRCFRLCSLKAPAAPLNLLPDATLPRHLLGWVRSIRTRALPVKRQLRQERMTQLQAFRLGLRTPPAAPRCLLLGRALLSPSRTWKLRLQHQPLQQGRAQLPTIRHSLLLPQTRLQRPQPPSLQPLLAAPELPRMLQTTKAWATSPRRVPAVFHYCWRRPGSISRRRLRLRKQLQGLHPWRISASLMSPGPRLCRQAPASPVPLPLPVPRRLCMRRATAVLPPAWAWRICSEHRLRTLAEAAKALGLSMQPLALEVCPRTRCTIPKQFTSPPGLHVETPGQAWVRTCPSPQSPSLRTTTPRPAVTGAASRPGEPALQIMRASQWVKRRN